MMSRPLAVSQSVSLARGGTARSGIGLVRNEPHPIDHQHQTTSATMSGKSSPAGHGDAGHAGGPGDRSAIALVRSRHPAKGIILTSGPHRGGRCGVETGWKLLFPATRRALPHPAVYPRRIF